MKKLFAALSIFAVLFSITLNASAAEVKIKGYGGITYSNGTAKICPNQSKDDCATLTISGTEIKDIKAAFADVQITAEKLLNEYRVFIANPEILK